MVGVLKGKNLKNKAQDGAIHFTLAIVLTVVLGVSTTTISNIFDSTHNELLKGHRFARLSLELDGYLNYKMNKFFESNANSSNGIAQFGCEREQKIKRKETYKNNKYEWQCTLMGEGRLERIEIQVSTDDFSRRGMTYAQPVLASISESEASVKLVSGEELKQGDPIFEEDEVTIDGGASKLEIRSVYNHQIKFEGKGSYSFGRMMNNFYMVTTEGQFTVDATNEIAPIHLTVNNVNVLVPRGRADIFSVNNGVMALIHSGNIFHVDSGKFLTNGRDGVSQGAVYALALIRHQGRVRYKIHSLIPEYLTGAPLSEKRDVVLNYFNRLFVDKTWESVN